MYPVRYIHAADLHLDASFRGLSQVQQTEFLAEQLRAATFTALDRIVALCEKEKPDFLVLAGDIYNVEDQSLKAQLHLRDACIHLNKLGIKVFIAHGNHDPLSSRLKMLSWPEDTIIFGDTVQSHVVTRDGKNIAVVHGISHATVRESRNLAKAFTRLSTDDCAAIFQLGVLHCTLEGESKADRYAPCSLEDLQNTELDAWALGHVHERRIISEKPFVAYSGNTQGLHINETGIRGCLQVSVTPTNIDGNSKNSFDIESKFHSLSPVIWASIEVRVDDAEHLDQVEQLTLQGIEQVVLHTDPQCTALIVRVRLIGRSELEHVLRKQDIVDDLVERIRKQVPAMPYIWLKDIVINITAIQPLDTLSKRDDLLGETLRLAKDIENDNDKLQNFVQTSLAPLLTHSKAKQILQVPTDEQAKELLEEAQRLCVDMMESR